MSMLGGDGDGDDQEAAKYWAAEEGQCWEPEGWHKSPLQLQEEARSELMAAVASSAAMAHKHCDPPAPAGRFREF
jgi:hypothetical protein